MIRKAAMAALLVGVLATAGHSSDGDNAASGPSYFEGVWVGSWAGYQDPTKTQDVVLTIGKRGPDGTFPVEYSWGAVSYAKGIVPPGSLRTKGREEGDTFLFEWKTKQGVEQKLTLQKLKDDVVKARIDRSGSVGTVARPYSETHLKRR